MISILEVAREAGVSKSTVSRVINSNGPVKPVTRERVEQAMNKLNYSPNVFAQGMRTNRSKSIGILFPDLSNPFFAEWYKTVEGITRRHGYMNYICITDEDGESEMQTINDLLARKIEGLLYFSYVKNERVMEKLRAIARNIPVVFADPVEQDEGDSYVFADGFMGTYKATQFLINQGRKRIAYIRGEERFWVTRDRFEGYKKALSENGFHIDKTLIMEGDFHHEGGYLATKNLMKQPHKPDAIMSATDVMALGCLKYLNEEEINVPEEIAVIGFDNISLSAISDPPLSTIALPIAKQAKAAIQYLIDRIENPETKPIQKILKCELVLRASI